MSSLLSLLAAREAAGMEGYVDRSRGGLTELRIHGVSGTPPAELLQHPFPARVAGDRTAGFYRRLWLTGSQSSADQAADGEADGPRRRLEAYSWGGLTAGSGQRALWLLLLPFMLVNVAFWMLPADPTSTDPARRAVRRGSALLQRLFALSMTLSLILSIVAVSVDLVGWQCTRTPDGCATRFGPLRFLTEGFFAEPGRRVAVTALVPIAVIALLWWLGHQTWNRYEGQPLPVGQSDPAAPALADRRIWNGAAPVRRLRSVHVAAAFSLVGLLAGGTVRNGAEQPFRLILDALFALDGAVLLLAVGLSARRKTAVRDTGPATRELTRRDSWSLLPWVAALLVGLILLVAMLPGVASLPAYQGADSASRGALPFYRDTATLLFAVQTVLLVAIFLVTAALVVLSRGTAQHVLTTRRALLGLGTPLLLLLAWLIAGAFGSGLVLRGAGFLGTPVPGRDAPYPSVEQLQVPVVYTTAAATTVAFVALAIPLAAATAIIVRFRIDDALERVRTAYDLTDRQQPNAPQPSADAERARYIARIWNRATLTEAGRAALGIFLLLLALVVAAVVLLHIATRGRWILDSAPWIVTWGSWLAGAFAMGLLALGWAAYRNPELRRTVGIAWDLGTFWPRATHPLAPPCYTERVLPDLMKRLEWLAPRPSDHVLLSTHSQGTVLGAAVILQLPESESARLSLVTYGSPLRRLYARFFPGYFGVPVLMDVGRRLVGPSAVRGDDAELTTATTADGSPGWPWRNLWRPSDPIGGYIFARDPEPSEPRQHVDIRILDPEFRKHPGDTTWPEILGHSDYLADPAYDEARRVVLELHADQRASRTQAAN